jgi:hypothetical protein
MLLLFIAFMAVATVVIVNQLRYIGLLEHTIELMVNDAIEIIIKEEDE